MRVASPFARTRSNLAGGHAEELELLPRRSVDVAGFGAPAARREELVLGLEDLRAVERDEGLSRFDGDAGLRDEDPLGEAGRPDVDLRRALLGSEDNRRHAERARAVARLGLRRPDADRLDPVERELDRGGPRRRRSRRRAGIGHRLRLESHLADGTPSRTRRADLGMHRARVARGGRAKNTWSRARRCARHRAALGDRLEIHMADRTLARLVRDNLRMHRAVVFRRRRGAVGLASAELGARVGEPHERREQSRHAEDDPADDAHRANTARRRLLALGHRLLSLRRLLSPRRRILALGFSGHDRLRD